MLRTKVRRKCAKCSWRMKPSKGYIGHYNHPKETVCSCIVYLCPQHAKNKAYVVRPILKDECYMPISEWITKHSVNKLQ